MQVALECQVYIPFLSATDARTTGRNMGRRSVVVLLLAAYNLGQN